MSSHLQLFVGAETLDIWIYLTRPARCMRCCCSRHSDLDDSSSQCPFGPVSVFIHYRLARAIASSLKPCEHLRYTPQSRLLKIPVYSQDSSFAGISGYWLALVKDVADLPLQFWGAWSCRLPLSHPTCRAHNPAGTCFWSVLAGVSSMVAE